MVGATDHELAEVLRREDGEGARAEPQRDHPGQLSARCAPPAASRSPPSKRTWGARYISTTMVYAHFAPAGNEAALISRAFGAAATMPQAA